MKKSEVSTARQILQLLRMVNIKPVYFILPFVLALVAAVFEGVGMSLLVPLLNGFLTEDYTFVMEIPVLGSFISHFSSWFSLRDRNLFIFLVVIFVGAIVLRNVIRFLANIILAFLTLRALHHLRKRLFMRYLTFGKLFFDRTTIGHHGTVLNEFTQQAFTPLLKSSQTVNALFTLLVYLIIMCAISWKLTLMTIPLFIVIQFVMRLIIMRIRHHSFDLSKRSKDLGKKVIEILTAVPLVKISNTEEQESQHYTTISDEQVKVQYRITILQQLIYPVQELITLFAALTLFGIMLYLLVLRNESNASSLLVYFYLILNSTNKLNVVSLLRSQFARASGPIDSIMEVFESEDKHIMKDGKEEFKELKNSIEFRDLSFSYIDEKKAIDKLSLTIPKGKMTAVVGSTGAGKSTLINLISRYYDVPEKSLFVDGKDIRDYKISSIREHIALVSQDAVLFNESLRFNITYGMNGVDDELLKKIVKQARLESFIERLPQGLETLIGDRGVQLSGGEKQRVSIARALLKDADILILDEATSSLDSETEKLIQEAIEEAIKGRTTIVIAHRLSTIKNADRIAVIENGKCAEQGTLDELLEKKGYFFRYWEDQKFN